MPLVLELFEVVDVGRRVDELFLPLDAGFTATLLTTTACRSLC